MLMSTVIFICPFLSFQIFSVCAFGILLWVRIDWGFEEWLHEAYFYNFWHGVYFLLSGMSRMSMTYDVGEKGEE